MNNLLPPWPLLSIFILASFVLAVTPGPGVFFIVTRALEQGRRLGLVSVAGVALGNLGNMIAASIGLATLFSISSIAFTLVKYAGALYLMYLGARALRAPSNYEVPTGSDKVTSSHLFRDGFVVAALNPKTTLFFAAFLPQFLSAKTESVIQSILLGSLFVGIAAVTDSCYALVAATVAPATGKMREVRVLGRYITAGALIGLGLFTAVTGSRGRH
jgi:threonine/homoserine/homoserine lactone efflux protein